MNLNDIVKKREVKKEKERHWYICEINKSIDEFDEYIDDDYKQVLTHFINDIASLEDLKKIYSRILKVYYTFEIIPPYFSGSFIDGYPIIVASNKPGIKELHKIITFIKNLCIPYNYDLGDSFLPHVEGMESHRENTIKVLNKNKQ
jgi:hypothetical protein